MARCGAPFGSRASSTCSGASTKTSRKGRLAFAWISRAKSRSARYLRSAKRGVCARGPVARGGQPANLASDSSIVEAKLHFMVRYI